MDEPVLEEPVHQEMVQQLRRFNRLVTQRVGALDDRFLARARPLGEARVRWEIGEDGCDVRLLRARLGVDSGYLSRLLRSLEAAGLAQVGAGRSDRRVRTARLTPAGRAERAVLDRRSDELAESILEPLTHTQRERLVSALADVERLFSLALVRFEPADVTKPEARRLLQAYAAELDRRVPSHAPSWPEMEATLGTLRPPHGLFLLVTLRAEPIGCGGLKLPPGEPAELKRMWLAESARGLGVGRRLLRELERRAAQHRARTIRRETNRSLTEALGLYRSSGYVDVERFNDVPHAEHWLAKPLPGG
jgi:DNA-binding MarR family transcriptional regulator/ribosomal protein S18 acetylase RimI-like enzyme